MWALMGGGGGNYALAVEFKIRLNHVPNVYLQLLTYTITLLMIIPTMSEVNYMSETFQR